MTTTTRLAGAAGRLTGTAARYAVWVHRTTDWAEVRAIVLHGLQVLVVLTLLAGRATRYAWDALPGWSEALGRRWRALLVPPVAAPLVHPLHAVALDLEQLSRRQLQAIAGTRRNAPKHHLIAMALRCS